MILLTIGIDEDGHVCQRSGFYSEGTPAQMATAMHVDYLLDEMGRWQDEVEGGPKVDRPERVSGWQLARLLEQLKQTV